MQMDGLRISFSFKTLNANGWPSGNTYSQLVRLLTKKYKFTLSEGYKNPHWSK